MPPRNRRRPFTTMAGWSGWERSFILRRRGQSSARSKWRCDSGGFQLSRELPSSSNLARSRPRKRCGNSCRMGIHGVHLVSGLSGSIAICRIFRDYRESGYPLPRERTGRAWVRYRTITLQASRVFESRPVCVDYLTGCFRVQRISSDPLVQSQNLPWSELSLQPWTKSFVCQYFYNS